MRKFAIFSALTIEDLGDMIRKKKKKQMRQNDETFGRDREVDKKTP